MQYQVQSSPILKTSTLTHPCINQPIIIVSTQNSKCPKLKHTVNINQHTTLSIFEKKFFSPGENSTTSSTRELKSVAPRDLTNGWEVNKWQFGQSYGSHPIRARTAGLVERGRLQTQAPHLGTHNHPTHHPTGQYIFRPQKTRQL